MIPPNVLSELGISFAQLVGSADLAKTLMQDLATARELSSGGAVYFRFRGIFLKANPGASFAQVSEAYAEAKAWTDIPQAVSGYPADLPLDPALFRPTQEYGRYAGEYGEFIMRVKVSVVDPTTGDTRTFGVDVRDQLTWNLEDIYSYAQDAMMDILAHYPQTYGGTPFEDIDITYQIDDLIKIGA